MAKINKTSYAIIIPLLLVSALTKHIFLEICTTPRLSAEQRVHQAIKTHHERAPIRCRGTIIVRINRKITTINTYLIDIAIYFQLAHMM